MCHCDQQQLIPKDAAKCLGFWWSWNLAANTAVDEAVKKARRTFFLFGGMHVFLDEACGADVGHAYLACQNHQGG